MSIKSLQGRRVRTDNSDGDCPCCSTCTVFSVVGSLTECTCNVYVSFTSNIMCTGRNGNMGHSHVKLRKQYFAIQKPSVICHPWRWNFVYAVESNRWRFLQDNFAVIWTHRPVQRFHCYVRARCNTKNASNSSLRKHIHLKLDNKHEVKYKRMGFMQMPPPSPSYNLQHFNRNGLKNFRNTTRTSIILCIKL